MGRFAVRASQMTMTTSIKAMIVATNVVAKALYRIALKNGPALILKAAATFAPADATFAGHTPPPHRTPSHDRR